MVVPEKKDNYVFIDKDFKRKMKLKEIEEEINIYKNFINNNSNTTSKINDQIKYRYKNLLTRNNTL